MDIATIAGLVAGVFFLVVSILLGGSLGSFADAPSVMIVIGGSASALLISYPMDKFLKSLTSVSLVFKNQIMNEGDVIRKIIELSNVARKEGLLALEEAASSIEDSFLKKGILLIVDGTDPELVRNILETELVFIEGRHKDTQGFWDKFGEMGPAWGMIGTLVGLVNMLQNLDDPSSIGPSMAVALLTTMYGSIMANFLFIPFSNKLKVRSSAEMLLKEVMIEGLLSIQAGENPRVIEEKLKAFLSPAIRESLNQAEATGGEGE